MALLDASHVDNNHNNEPKGGLQDQYIADLIKDGRINSKFDSAVNGCVRSCAEVLAEVPKDGNFAENVGKLYKEGLNHLVDAIRSRALQAGPKIPTFQPEP